MAYNPNAIWTSKQHLPGTPARPEAPQKTPPPAEPPREPEPPRSSPEPEEPSFFRRHALILFAILLVVILGGTAAAVFIMQKPAPPKVTIGFSLPKSLTVGAPTLITVSSANESNVPLGGATLTITLPSGMSFLGDNASETAKEYSLGTIGAGTVAAQTSTIVVTGNPESLQRISAALTYTTPDAPSTTIETDGVANVLIGDSAISLTYGAPQNIVSGQSFSFTVNYHNDTQQDVAGVSLEAAYPPAFSFVTSSIPTTDATNDTWNIGTIPAGTGGSFTVTGTIMGQPQAQYQMGGTVLVNMAGQNYPVNVQTLSLVVAQPPLALTITPNNSTTYISSAGDSLQYTLAYTNNSNVTFTGVNISAALAGQMFDYASLQTDGSFSSKSDTITWSAASTPALSSVAPGQTGTVTFFIKTKSSYPIKLASDKDYVLRVYGTIQSPTVAPNTAGTSTVAMTQIQTKVGGGMTLTAVGLLGSGPYPPKVNEATQYQVKWDIVNYATDVQNVTVSAYLQSGTMLAGSIQTNLKGSSSTPTYNSQTGLISWTIPAVAAGTGVLTPPIEAVIPISNIPAVNQIGHDVTLFGPTSLTATDGFTGQTMTATADAITTALPNDPKADHQSGGSVIQ